MIKKEVVYQADKSSCNGLVVYDDACASPKPAVLVVHDWTGRNAYADAKAHQLAELGFVGFAVDVYGGHKTGTTNEEKGALATPFFEDRQLIMTRMKAAFDTVAALSQVDEQRIAAIGYCFGGMCVLDLARSGADVKGVVSFHGLLNAPAQKKCVHMTSNVLVLHGYDDPMVPPSALDEFADEMTEAQVDWQLHSYGHTLHAFTNPLANDITFGTLYDEKADRRSWAATRQFLKELFDAH